MRKKAIPAQIPRNISTARQERALIAKSRFFKSFPNFIAQYGAGTMLPHFLETTEQSVNFALGLTLQKGMKHWLSTQLAQNIHLEEELEINHHLLDCVLAEYSASYQSNPHRLRTAIGPVEMWRFFIDGRHQGRGWQPYEQREPGYLQAMIKAFALIFLPSGDLTQLIISLHEIATSGVRNLLYQHGLGKKECRHHFRYTNNVDVVLK